MKQVQLSPRLHDFGRFAYGMFTYVAALSFGIYLFGQSSRGNWWAILVYPLAGYALCRTAHWNKKPGVHDVYIAFGWFPLAFMGTMLYLTPGFWYTTFYQLVRDGYEW